MKEIGSGDIAQALISFWAHNLGGVILYFFIFLILYNYVLLYIDLHLSIMYMELGGVHDTPLYLLSKGEKSNKFLRMCCQQFQRGRLLSMVKKCYHCC